jgi:hypothetical protein
VVPRQSRQIPAIAAAGAAPPGIHDQLVFAPHAPGLLARIILVPRVGIPVLAGARAKSSLPAATPLQTTHRDSDFI